MAESSDQSVLLHFLRLTHSKQSEFVDSFLCLQARALNRELLEDPEEEVFHLCVVLKITVGEAEQIYRASRKLVKDALLHRICSEDEAKELLVFTTASAEASSLITLVHPYTRSVPNRTNTFHAHASGRAHTHN